MGTVQFPHVPNVGEREVFQIGTLVTVLASSANKYPHTGIHVEVDGERYTLEGIGFSMADGNFVLKAGSKVDPR